jgi:hypothetical protein
MPVATTVHYENCPPGDDIPVTLAEVKELVNDADAQFNPGETRWRWIFETDNLTNSDDEPFKVSLYTGTSYLPGNPQCKLTKLLDKICRNLTTAQKQEIDTDDLLGKKFMVDITHVTTKQGRTMANIDNIKRVAPAAKAEPQAAKKAIKPAPPVDDDDDPFALDE